MLYLIATILLNVVLSSLFKLFPRFKIDTLLAIVVNYWVCVVTGCIFMGQIPYPSSVITSAWLPYSFIMGTGFILVFNIIAACTHKDGITTTTIASKLSMVIPVIFSIIAYHESAGLLKIAGILLAFPAVWLTSRVHEKSDKIKTTLLPVLLFLGSGTLDTLMNYVQMRFLFDDNIQTKFSIYSFGFAAIFGTLGVIAILVLGKMKIHLHSILAGIVLGIPNFFSIYFFLRLLNSHYLQSSASIPVCNIGVLVASSLTALIFFREKAVPMRLIGIVSAIVAILLIAFGD